VFGVNDYNIMIIEHLIHRVTDVIML